MTGSVHGSRLGAQLAVRRRLLGLTQAEVADLAGTTQRTVSQAETGKAGRLEVYAGIAHTIGLEVVAVPHNAEASRPEAPSP